MNKRKLLLGAATITTIAAPIVSVVSCGVASEQKYGGILTEYVRAHDFMLSLGIAPQWNARSDISTTHDKTNEHYLEEFANDSTKNGRRYNGGDREYFASLNLGMFVARSLSDSKGYLQDVKHKIGVKNSDLPNDTDYVNYENGSTDGDLGLNWGPQMVNIAKNMDVLSDNGTKFEDRAKLINSKWLVRQKQLIADAKAFEATKRDGVAANTPLNTIIVQGGESDTSPSTIWSGIKSANQLTELYALPGFKQTQPDDVKTLSSSYKVGKSPSPKNSGTKTTELHHIYDGKSDVVIYLKTITSSTSDDAIRKEMEPLLKDKGNSKLLIVSYDDWLLPFRGAAIGANVVMDNIESDIFGKTDIDASWKSDFNKDNLESIYLTK